MPELWQMVTHIDAGAIRIGPPIWSAADIGREIEHFDADAVLRPLRNAGLIHRTSDGFVFATAAAFRMVQMVGQVV